MKHLTEAQYKAAFAEPEGRDSPEKEADSRAGRALAFALDIRKFEIELYWKRATYFWGFIAAAFAAYALTYKSGTAHEPWLSLLFSCLGIVFSWAWFLANRGSKFWQQNWERHVDLLEDMTLGPLYKTVATSPDVDIGLFSAARYSVTKLNQILSLFVTLVWVPLIVKALLPFGTDRDFDGPKFAVAALTLASLWALAKFGKSRTAASLTHLEPREHRVEA
ncbi:MAG: hypothetical protein IBJ14_09980 [Hydrogenophaga sp.]|nr:hypothetical protein [Hydrogenophaga sp.]